MERNVMQSQMETTTLSIFFLLGRMWQTSAIFFSSRVCCIDYENVELVKAASWFLSVGAIRHFQSRRNEKVFSLVRSSLSSSSFPSVGRSVGNFCFGERNDDDNEKDGSRFFPFLAAASRRQLIEWSELVLLALQERVEKCHCNMHARAKKHKIGLFSKFNFRWDHHWQLLSRTGSQNRFVHITPSINVKLGHWWQLFG